MTSEFSPPSAVKNGRGEKGTHAARRERENERVRVGRKSESIGGGREERGELILV